MKCFGERGRDVYRRFTWRIDSGTGKRLSRNGGSSWADKPRKKSSVRSQPAANPDGFFLLSVLLVFLRFLLNLFAAALNVLAGALDCIAAGKPGEEDVRCSKH